MLQMNMGWISFPADLPTRSSAPPSHLQPLASGSQSAWRATGSARESHSGPAPRCLRD